MAILLLLSMAGALLLWKLSASGEVTPADADAFSGAAGKSASRPESRPESEPAPAARLRTRLLGGLGLALQLPILIVVPLLLLQGGATDAVSVVTAVGMLVLPAIFAVLGLRLLLGRIEPRA